MKKVLFLASLMALAVSSAYAAPIQGEYISKTLFKDVNGGYHFVASKDSQSLMNIDQVKKTGIWVIQDPSKIAFQPSPVHKVLGVTEEEYEAMLRQNNGGDSIDAE